MKRTPKRLVIIDLIRAASFIAIVIFHMTYALWGRTGLNVIPDTQLSTQVLEIYGRLLGFSGFTVLFLSFFLFGYQPNRNWKKLWITLFGFFLVWAALSGEFPYIWDVYPYLLVVILLAAFLRSWPGWIVASIGAIVVSIPFWRLESYLNWPPIVTGTMFGNCTLSNGVGEDWPLLPWIGLPIFALGVGQLAHRHAKRLQNFSFAEGVFWLLALVSTAPYLGGYFSVPIGDHFACYVFRRPPVTFWSHQLCLILLLRVGFLPAVNNWLESRSFFKWLSGLAINRSFFLAYFVHYPYCLAWAAFASAIAMNPATAFAVGVVTCLIWAECLPRLLRPFMKLVNQADRVNGSSVVDFKFQLSKRRL
jgi:uncharacterized membrane protein